MFQFVSGRSVHLTTLFFLGKLDLAVEQYFMHILSLVTLKNLSLNQRKGGEWP